MSRPLFSALASLARAPVSAEARRARSTAIQAAYDAEQAWLKKPCPTPLAGFRVAVVGAGLAGLSAALTLARLGMRVQVYEARAEVGGRVQTNPTHFRGRVTETGAELIGAIHPMCLSIARQHGIAMITRTDDEAAHQMQLSSRVLIDGAFLTQKELLALTKKMHDDVLLPIARHARIVADPAAPWKQALLKPWDKVMLGTMLRKRFGIKPGSALWRLLELLLVNDNVAPLDELNYLALLCQVRAGHSGRSDHELMGYWEDLENFRCADGSQTIARRMSEDLVRKPLCALHMRTAVTAIDLAGVPRVTWNRVDNNDRIMPGSQSEDFDYIVLATPPSVWRHTTVTPKALGFPGSPGSMHMGPAIKFFTGFDERFWIKQGFAALGGADGLGQVWEGTDNQTRLPEQPLVLSVFAGGVIPSDASIVKNLERLYPGYARLAKKPLWARWPSEAFIETGYASPAKEQVFSVGQALNQPFAKRMCFAGEHTSMAYFGYMEGALRSGLRAARQIVGLACGSKPVATTPAPTPMPTPTPAPRVQTAEAEAPEPLAEEEVIDQAVEPELDPGGEYEARFEFDSPAQADRKLIRSAAHKIDAGLRAATAALALAPAGPTRELADFIVSLLRTHFFPRGHGEVGADRKVLKASARARIEMTIEKSNGSRWPFEHRVRLSLAAHRADRAWVGGEAGGEFFSVITLYVPGFDKLSDAGAASVAIHECVHMLFRMIEKLRERHGDEVARRFVSRQPWRRLDTQPLEAHRQAVAAQIESLRKLLPMQVGSDELAASLLQEGFAYTLSQWVQAAIDFAAAARKRGPKVVVESVAIAPILVHHYVLERAPSFAAALAQPEVVKAVQALAPALEAMADALRRMWGPAFQPREPNPSAREVLEAVG